MKSRLDALKLSNALLAKRGRKSLSKVAEEMDGLISIPTISRLEVGQRQPNLNTFFVICDWLGMPATEFIITEGCDQKEAS